MTYVLPTIRAVASTGVLDIAEFNESANVIVVGEAVDPLLLPKTYPLPIVPKEDSPTLPDFKLTNPLAISKLELLKLAIPNVAAPAVAPARRGR
jgi:hypothetical protein